jgi:hypothetical protein
LPKVTNVSVNDGATCVIQAQNIAQKENLTGFNKKDIASLRKFAA